MTTINISISKDFSDVPLGRFLSDGDSSGEKFREKYLYPNLAKEYDIVIDLDGTEGYGSSFLEEAFGGLVRRGFDPDFILKKINFISLEDPSLIEEITGYIKSSQKELHE